MTITEFLEARIAEDEREALDAPKMSDVYDSHRAAFTPALRKRALAEVTAKRAIVGEHAPVKDEGWISGKAHDYLWCGSCGSLDDAPVAFPCETVLAIAAIYSDHPDYATARATDSK